MLEIHHDITHQYQNKPSNCSQTALSILLSHYKVTKSQDDIAVSVPQCKDEAGKEIGSINQQLATWCISLGFKVSFYTFDCQIIDLSWQEFSSEQVIDRLEAGKNGYMVPALEQLWSNAYRQSYIDYLNAGGELYIQPAVTTTLLYELLQQGPLLPCVSYSTLYGVGRSNDQTDFDDVNGKAWNHSVVIYGNDENGNFLIADPMRKPGLHVIEPERMIAAISTAQIECDNLLFQIQK